MSTMGGIKNGERHELEFKFILNERGIKYLKTVVAFANGNGEKA